MKIDENCINHNALRLIDEILSDPYGLCYIDGDKTDETNFRIAMVDMGTISGVLSMAKAMKEVLKT